MFCDPAKGDYSVKDESPALKAGFKNFPMDQFGVLKPGLKAIAKMPVLPVVKRATAMSAPPGPLSGNGWGCRSRIWRERNTPSMGWRGTRVASGSSEETYPLQKGDLIQGLNGQPVKSCADLEKAPVTHPMRVSIVRDQQPRVITIP